MSRTVLIAIDFNSLISARDQPFIPFQCEAPLAAGRCREDIAENWVPAFIHSDGPFKYDDQRRRQSATFSSAGTQRALMAVDTLGIISTVTEQAHSWSHTNDKPDALNEMGSWNGLSRG